MPRAMFSRPEPIMSDGMPHATSTHSIPRRTEPRDSSSVLPCSVVTIRASSSKCSSSRFLNANIVRARSATGVARHAGNAAFAAATAASTSPRVESGVFAMTAPVAGLKTSTVPEGRASTHIPPMKLESTGVSGAWDGEDALRALAGGAVGAGEAIRHLQREARFYAGTVGLVPGEQRPHAIEDSLRDLGFREQRQLVRSRGIDQRDPVRVGAESAIRLRDIVRHDEGEPFLLQLLSRVREKVARFGGESDDACGPPSPRAHLRDGPEDVGRALELEHWQARVL